VSQRRPALFRGRRFEDVIILLWVRWYLRYSLTYRGLEEITPERNLSVDHVTIWRWVQRLCAHSESANSPRDAGPESVLAGG
jgi:transposase, IS6 family